MRKADYEIEETSAEHDNVQALKITYKDGKSRSVIMKGALAELFRRALDTLYAKDSDYEGAYSLESSAIDNLPDIKDIDMTVENINQTSENKPGTVVIKDGVEYRITGALDQLITRALSEIGTSASVENEDGVVDPVIYCVSIAEVSEEDVEAVRGKIESGEAVTLLAVNPGKAQRTDSMEQLERLCEVNDVIIYHDVEALAYYIKSTDRVFGFKGPIADLVQQVLSSGEGTEKSVEETGQDASTE